MPGPSRPGESPVPAGSYDPPIAGRFQAKRHRRLHSIKRNRFIALHFVIERSSLKSQILAKKVNTGPLATSQNLGGAAYSDRRRLPRMGYRQYHRASFRPNHDSTNALLAHRSSSLVPASMSSSVIRQSGQRRLGTCPQYPADQSFSALKQSTPSST